MSEETKIQWRAAESTIADMLSLAEAGSPGWQVSSVFVNHLSEAQGGPEKVGATIQTLKTDSTAPPFEEDWADLNRQFSDLLDVLEGLTDRRVLDGHHKPLRSGNGEIENFKLAMDLSSLEEED